MDANETAVVNEDQGKVNTSFDVPNDGVGYYLVPAVTESSSRVYKYSNSKTQKFTEYTSGTMAYTYQDLSSKAQNETIYYQVRKYTFEQQNGQTVTINSACDFSAEGAINGDGLDYESEETAITLVGGAIYKIWLNYDPSNLSLGVETVDKIPSTLKNDEDVLESESKEKLVKRPKKALMNYSGTRIYIEEQTNENWSYDGGGDVHIVFEKINFADDSIYSDISDLDGLSFGNWSGVLSSGKYAIKMKWAGTHKYEVQLPWYFSSFTLTFYAGSEARILYERGNGDPYELSGSVGHGYCLHLTNDSGKYNPWWEAGTSNYRTAISKEDNSSYKYNQTSYVLTASAGTGGTVTGGGTYVNGKKVSVTASPNDGYTFSSWSDGKAQTHEVEMTDDISISATFALKKYTATASVDSGSASYGSVAVSPSGSQNYGTSVTVTATPNEGYHVHHWTLNGATVDNSESVNSYTFAIHEDRSYVVYFAPNTYEVTLNRQGGTSGETSVTATYDSKLPSNVAAPDGKTGWTFGGYYSEAGGKGDCYYDANMVPQKVWETTGDGTLYAKWTANITLNVNGGDGSNGSISGVVWNSSYDNLNSLPSKAGGYVFLGYYTGASSDSGTQVYNGKGVAQTSNWLYETTLYAHWQRCYIVNFSGGAGSSGNVDPAYGTIGGKALMPSVGFTKTGYHVETGSEWISENGETTYAAGNSYPFGLSSGQEVTLKANWVPDTYTVTFANGSVPAGNNGAVSIPAAKVTYDSTYGAAVLNSDGTTSYWPTGSQEGITAPTGYQFAGWYKEASCTNAVSASDTVNITANTTFYAKWSPKTYTVNQATHTNGSLSAGNSGTFDSALALSWSSRVRTGYQYTLTSVKVYSGTNTSGTLLATYSSGTENSFTMAGTYYENICIQVIYAEAPKTYTVTLSQADATSEGTKSVTATFDQSLPSGKDGPLRTGYTFTGYWSNSDGTGSQYYDANMAPTSTAWTADGGGTIFAGWQIIVYTIHVDNNDGAGASDKTYSIDGSTQNITLDTPSYTGYTFNGYTVTTAGSGTGTVTVSSKTTLVIPAGHYGDVYVEAQWEANVYTVTLNRNTGTGGSSSVQATYDQAMPSATIPTKAGYDFGGYFTSNDSGLTFVKQYYFANGNSANKWDVPVELTLYAKWTARTYSIHFDSNGGSGTTEDHSNLTYDSGDDTLRSNGYSRTGYDFIGWAISSANAAAGTVDHIDGASLNSVVPSQNNETINLYAVWKAHTYTVVFEGNENTGGSMSPQSFNYGETKSLTTNAFTKTGYHFVRWLGSNSVSYTNGQSVSNLTTDDGATITMTAQWEINTYTLAFNAHSGTGSMASITNGRYNETYTLPSNSSSITKTNFTFAGWDTSSNGTSVVYADGAEYKFLPSETGTTITLYAVWQYELTFNVADTSGSSSTSIVTYGSTYGNGTAGFADATRNDLGGGWTFQGWYNGATRIYSSTSVTTYISSLTAKWARQSGLYIIGKNINGQNADGSSDPWVIEEATKASTYDSGATGSNNIASWLGVSLGAGTAFRIVEYNGSSLNYHWVLLQGSARDNNWFSQDASVKSDKDIVAGSAFSAGYYSIYYNGNREVSITKVIVINLDLNGGGSTGDTQLSIAKSSSGGDLSTGDTLPDLAGKLPTAPSSDVLFAGYWTSKIGEGTQYYYPDGKPAKKAEDVGTLYARWYAKTGYFFEGETYYLVPGNWADHNYDFYAWPCNGPSVDYGFSAKLVASHGAYAYTVPSGIYKNIVFVAVDSNSSPAWKTNIAGKSVDTIKRSAEQWEAFNGGHAFRITSDAAGEGSASSGEYIKEFTSENKTEPEVVYLDATGFGTPGTNVYAVYLFGGSTETWLPLTRIDASANYYSVEIPGSGRWAGAIFVYFPAGTSQNSFSLNPEGGDQTPELFRTSGAKVCYTCNSNTWTEVTKRSPGYYLIGSGVNYNGSNWTIEWRLDSDTSDKTREMIATETPGTGNNGKWTSLTFPASSVFKIVRVVGKVPSNWYGYSSAQGHINVASFFAADTSDNIEVQHACTVNLYFNQSNEIYIDVTSYADTAVGKGYSTTLNQADSDGNISSMDVVVSVNGSGIISGVSSPAEANTYFSFDHYAYADAVSGSILVPDTPSYSIAGASVTLPTIYAIYIRDNVTLTVQALYQGTPYTVKTMDIDKGVALSNYTIITVPASETEYNLLYTSNKEGALYAFRPKSSTLYTTPALSNENVLGSSSSINANTTAYVDTLGKDAVTFYLDITGLVAWKTYGWQIHFYPKDTMNEYFHIDANSPFKIATNLYKVTMPASWVFYLGNGAGSLDHNGYNWVNSIDTSDSHWTEMVLTYSQDSQGTRHGYTFLSKASSHDGIAKIIINGDTDNAVTMSKGDWSTNFFIYEKGIQVNKGASVSIAVTGTDDNSLNTTFDASNYGGTISSIWYLEKGSVSSDTVTALIDNDLNWSEVYAYAWYTDNGNTVSNAAWPGQKMTANVDSPSGYGSYYIDLDKSTYINIIFNKGDSSGQTAGNSLDLSKVNTFEVNYDSQNNNIVVTPSAITPEGANTLYSTANARFNFYIYKSGNAYRWSIAAVPSLGNGYYIMNTADNGKSNSGYNGALKMITNTDGNGASYSHYKVTQGTTIYVRSYQSGQDTLMTTNANSAQASGASLSGSIENAITLSAGYYSIVVENGNLVVSGYEESSFFTLNAYDFGGSKSIYDSQTALLLEVEITIHNNAPMNLTVNASNGFGGNNAFVGYYATVTSTKQSSAYDTIRESIKENYIANLSGRTSFTISQTLDPVGSANRTNEKAYVYILVDYVSVDLSTFDITKFGSSIGFTICVEQA